MLGSLILRVRHLFFDKGWVKSFSTEVPSICIGNLAVGGTGKTPMTELVVRTLLEDSNPAVERVVKKEDIQLGGLFSDVELFDGHDFGGVSRKYRRVAVLSRGYKRKTKGFQQVVPDGTAALYGDEPLQVKRKFPSVVVAVDADRVEGASFLANPSRINALPDKKKKAILHPAFPKSDIIILDDAFQHRSIKANKNIILTAYDRPFFKDRLMPWGKLRDLRSRASGADMIVVTKCPTYLDEWEKSKWALRLGLKNYDLRTCTGVNSAGRTQILLFSTILYDKLMPVFDSGDARYIHAKSAILVTGIANDTALQQHLCEHYKVQEKYKFADHHYFSFGEIRKIEKCAKAHPISVVITTEKDAQRIRDFDMQTGKRARNIGEDLRRRLFYAPIRTMMLTQTEQKVFKEFINK